jgi:hypothetical protein
MSNLGHHNDNIRSTPIKRHLYKYSRAYFWGGYGLGVLAVFAVAGYEVLTTPSTFSCGLARLANLPEFYTLSQRCVSYNKPTVK